VPFAPPSEAGGRGSSTGNVAVQRQDGSAPPLVVGETTTIAQLEARIQQTEVRRGGLHQAGILLPLCFDKSNEQVWF